MYVYACRKPPKGGEKICECLQTCQTKSAVSQVHDWVVYKLGSLLGSVGHRVQIHKITSATGKERGDLVRNQRLCSLAKTSSSG